MTVKTIEDETRADRISQIIELTKCSKEEAITVLYDCDNDVERAISHIFDHGKLDDEWQTSKTASKPKNKNPGPQTNQKNEEKKSTASVGNGKPFKGEKFRFHRDAAAGKPSSGRGGKSSSGTNDKRNFDQHGGGGANNKPNHQHQQHHHHSKEDNSHSGHQASVNNSMQPVVDEWDPTVEYGEWTGEDIEVFNSDANLVLESCAKKEVDVMAVTKSAASSEDERYDALYNNIFRTKPVSKKPASGVNFQCTQPVIISPNALAKSEAGKASIPKFSFGDATLKQMMGKWSPVEQVASTATNGGSQQSHQVQPSSRAATAPVAVASTAYSSDGLLSSGRTISNNNNSSSVVAAAPIPAVKQCDMFKIKQQQQQQQHHLSSPQVNGVQNVMPQMQKPYTAHLPPGIHHLMHPFNTQSGSTAASNSYQSSQYSAATNSAGNTYSIYENERYMPVMPTGGDKSLGHSKQQQQPPPPSATSTTASFAGPGFHPHHAPHPPPPHPSQQTFNQLHQVVTTPKLNYMHPNTVIYMPNMYTPTGPPPPPQTAYMKSTNNNNNGTNAVAGGGNNGGGGPNDHLESMECFEKYGFKMPHQQQAKQQNAGPYKNAPSFNMPDHHGGGGTYNSYAISDVSPYFYQSMEATSQNPHLLHSLQHQQQGAHRN